MMEGFANGAMSYAFSETANDVVGYDSMPPWTRSVISGTLAFGLTSGQELLDAIFKPSGQRAAAAGQALVDGLTAGVVTGILCGSTPSFLDSDTVAKARLVLTGPLQKDAVSWASAGLASLFGLAAGSWTEIGVNYGLGN